MEIWDGGLLLIRQQVPVKLKGEFAWNHFDEVPETPTAIGLAVFDPELPLSCADYETPASRGTGTLLNVNASNVMAQSFRGDSACSGPSKGGIDYLSTFWVGSSPDEAKPFSSANQSSYRVLEGSDGSDLELDGLFVGRSKAVLLEQQNADGNWTAIAHLTPNVVDIAHLKVNIPPEHLANSGTLGFSIFEYPPQPELGSDVKEPQQILYVASKQSPVLLSVDPPSVSPDEIANGPFHILFDLHGSGFTSASRVVQSLYDIDLNYQGATRFISPTELQVDLYKDRFISGQKWSGMSPVRLWVANGDWLHLSEPMRSG